MKRVLVACEYSGTVRDAFLAKGFDAWSCDLMPTTSPGPHIRADVRTILGDGWDMMIAHPPCTYLAYVGMPWFAKNPARWKQAEEAFELFMDMVNAPIPMIAVENPRGLPLKWYRQSDQVIEPYWFGDIAKKETHLWLKNLPYLFSTLVISNPIKNWTEHNRSVLKRNKTFPGVARAMADQWGYVLQQVAV